MKILVTGANGQLGYDVIKRLNLMNLPCQGVDIADFDLTDKDAVVSYVKDYNPTRIIHCAAYTAVDKAEHNKSLCSKINIDGTLYIATAAKEVNAGLMYISTDYVFDGAGEDYHEIHSPKEPLNHYGYTKLQGEAIAQELISNLFIVRTSWVFGINGNNFVNTMLRLAKERDTINVVADQVGSPTYTYDLAILICDMIQTEKYGIYHATNENICSWYEFAQEIFRLTNTATKVNPILTQDYPTIAVRPKNSRLSKKSLDQHGFQRLPAWQDALQRYINEKYKYNK